MSASIFNGTAVKILKNILRFKDGTELASSDIATFATLTGVETLTNKTLTDPKLTTGGTLDVTAAGTLSIAASMGANDLTLGASASKVVIPGDLEVNGTATYVNTTDLEVVDANITLNKNGTQSTADTQDGGFTIEMSDATNAAIGYNSTLASKFMCGEVGSLVEIADISSAQSFTNKTIDSDSNSISNIINANIKSSAAIAVDKLASLTVSRALATNGSGVIEVSSTTNTELGYVSGVTSSIQTQLNAKVDTVYDVASDDGTFTATANKTYIVDTSSVVAAVTLPAVAANIYVTIKDNGNANANNITVTPASGTIDGAATDVINSNYGSITYISNGTNWYKV